MTIQLHLRLLQNEWKGIEATDGIGVSYQCILSSLKYAQIQYLKVFLSVTHHNSSTSNQLFSVFLLKPHHINLALYRLVGYVKKF